MAKKSFETSLARLEEITSELEHGELSLENSLKKFEEGVQLVRFCSDQLAEARARVDILVGKNGSLKEVPFAENSSEHTRLPE